jgi:hypothetical protein
MKKIFCFFFIFCSSYGIFSQVNTSGTDSTKTAAEPDAVFESKSCGSNG